jgi:hypothetical protein
MPGRTRNQTFPRPGGKAAFNWEGPYDPSPGAQVTTDSANCTDVTGNAGDCEPLTITKLTTQGGIVNRTFGGTDTDNWFSNWICQYFRTSSGGQHLSVTGVPNDATRCTEAVKRTNPSRPYVDVPVNLLDMRGGIQRIRDAGNSIRSAIRRSGGHVLEYEFMIKPLVGDIVKLLNAGDQIDRRIAEINRMYDNPTGLRRTVSHGSWSSVAEDSSLTIQSTYDVLRAYARWTTTVNCRTHVRWAPQSRVGLKPSPHAIRAMAVRSVLGLTVDFSTLWEIMPWSWMIDWFGNVGDFLVANRNIVPARLIGVYPMKHTRTEFSFPAFSRIIRGRPTTVSSGLRIRESKTRSIGAVALSAHFPFLDRRQVGILAALAASRR